MVAGQVTSPISFPPAWPDLREGLNAVPGVAVAATQLEHCGWKTAANGWFEPYYGCLLAIRFELPSGDVPPLVAKVTGFEREPSLLRKVTVVAHARHSGATHLRDNHRFASK